jgi:plasmid stabilization system protein ParE
MKFVVVPGVSGEFREAVAWYRGRDPRSATNFIEAVHAAFVEIIANPRLGSRPPNVPDRAVRWMRVAKFPYHVVFVTIGDVTHVLAIAHDRRRPGYYLSRVRR